MRNGVRLVRIFALTPYAPTWRSELAAFGVATLLAWRPGYLQCYLERDLVC